MWSISERVKMAYDYEPVKSDQLKYKAGDIITVISKKTQHSNFWEGELNGRKGFFYRPHVLADVHEGMSQT